MIQRLKNVQKITSRGKAYYYHRPTKTRIQATYGTQAFIDEVNNLNRALEAAKPAPSTVGALMVAYRSAPEFLGLADRTKADYCKIMDWLDAIGHMPLNEFTPRFALGLRDKALEKRGRHFANYVVAFGSLLFSWGSGPVEITEGNPFKQVSKIRRNKNEPLANRAWSAAELRNVLDECSESMKAAIALGAYAGIRKGDMLTLTWAAWDGEYITYKQSKTGTLVEVYAHESLRDILNTTKKRGLNIVTTNDGRPYTASGFGTQFYKLIKKLEAEDKVGKGLTFHGLRHTTSTMIADADGDTRDIMSVTGHKTESVVAIYTASANQKKRSKTAIQCRGVVHSA